VGRVVKTLVLLMLSVLLMIIPLFEGIGVNMQRHYMKKQLRENKLSSLTLDTLMISKQLQVELKIKKAGDEFDFLNNRYDLVTITELDNGKVQLIAVQDKFEKELLIALSKQMENPNSDDSKISILNCKWYYEESAKLYIGFKGNSTVWCNPWEYISIGFYHSIFRPPIFG